MPAPRKPQDHLAARAEAKATPRVITFEHDGLTYTVTSEAAEDVELFEAIEDEKYMSAVRGFLGREQWAAFKDAHRTPAGRVPMPAMESLLNALMGAIGQGNS